jgi:branched-chain amino acid transport system ATP-binding protein
MLEISNLTVTSDGKPVVKDVTLMVERGQVTALLGANGAGKSELVLCVAGLMKPQAGRISVDGIDLTGKTPDFIRSAGVAAVPEGHQVLTRLSVEDNLRAAGSMLRKAELQAELAHVYQVFPELAERKGQIAGTMSGGQQQMLAIGHAMMARPHYLLIDEMSLGLAPLIVKRLATVVADLTSKGMGVLLVEQFVEVALSLASHVVVLRKGEMRLSVHPDDVRSDREKLHAAYL